MPACRMAKGFLHLKLHAMPSAKTLGEPTIIPVMTSPNYQPLKNSDIVAEPPQHGKLYHAMLYPVDSLNVEKGKDLFGTYDMNWLNLLFDSNYYQTFVKIPSDKKVAVIYVKNDDYIGIATRQRLPGRGKKMSSEGIMWLNPTDTITNCYIVKFCEPG